MTDFEHLTRDHFFDGDKITGLSEDEQAKLHGPPTTDIKPFASRVR